jgi:hypothetical protein
MFVMAFVLAITQNLLVPIQQKTEMTIDASHAGIVLNRIFLFVSHAIKKKLCRRDKTSKFFRTQKCQKKVNSLFIT